MLTLLAALTALLIAALLLALPERLVAQILLLADHVAELVERRHHVVVHVVAARLAGPRHLQVLQHLLQLVEQLLRRILGAGARELLEPVDHALEILRPQHAGIAVERARELLGILAQLLGQRLHELVERGAQIVGELFDLLVGRAALQRLAQRLLRLAQRGFGIGELPSSIITAMPHSRATTSRNWSSDLEWVSCQ